ncbi:sensor histidine kinase [Nocardia sp. NPDC050710]|uniref:sensor histidine kinase n=1 Tax=Nocardia sp. NPDC050710 TaxID=3157220 RepID=UPI0033CF34C6
MFRPRTLTWVADFLYLSVLLAGLAVAWTGTGRAGGWQTIGFVGALALAGGLEFAESPRWGTRVTAISGLAARVVLYTVITALDPAGNAKVLFVLIPLTAYFSLGPRVAFALGAGGPLLADALVGAHAELRRDAETLSDLLMLAVGVVFALAIAVIARREEAGRERAESLLAELSDAHRRLREYADQATSLATLAERNRLARDIHDTVGHHLVVTAIQLEKAAAYRPIDAAVADQALAESRASTRRALTEVRHAVGALRADDTGFTLAAALRALVTRLDDSAFAITVELSGTEQQVREPARLALYLAAQEALTNARRHAAATAVTIRVTLTATAGTLDIADNGTGFAQGSSEGQGLTGMRQRLALLGGSVEITTGSTGTRLVATIPAAA